MTDAPMPARDTHHHAVYAALVREGWTITDDPLTLPVGLHNVFVDLGAERLLAAERGTERIAVEIKSFVGQSEVADVQQALGQFLMYRSLLRRRRSDREMVLAVPVDAWDGVLTSELGRVLLEDYALTVLVFDPVKEVILRWHRPQTTARS